MGHIQRLDQASALMQKNMSVLEKHRAHGITGLIVQTINRILKVFHEKLT